MEMRVSTQQGQDVSAKSEEKYNVVVIGGGTAGLVTAAGTAALGGRVALVERNKMGGRLSEFWLCAQQSAHRFGARDSHDSPRPRLWITQHRATV